MRPGAEADDSYGVIEFGSCGFTHSDGALAYPRDMYAALAGEQIAAQCWHTSFTQVPKATTSVPGISRQFVALPTHTQLGASQQLVPHVSHSSVGNFF